MGPAHAAWSLSHSVPAAIVAYRAGMPPDAAALLVTAATVTAGGRLSPDIDQHPRSPWRHRRETHWWGWPAAGALLAAGAAAAALLWPWWWWPCALLAGWAAGWGSHVTGDFLCGKAWIREGRVLRSAGVPLTLRGEPVGVLGRRRGFRSGGPVAGVLAFCVSPVAAAFVGWQALGLPGL